jgi:hypothetical protein
MEAYSGLAFLNFRCPIPDHCSVAGCNFDLLKAPHNLPAIIYLMNALLLRDLQLQFRFEQGAAEKRAIIKISVITSNSVFR